MAIKEEYSLTPQELADILNITVQGAHHLLKKNDVFSKRKGQGRQVPSSDVRRLFESRGFKYKQQVISVHACKGGVGKTVTALHLAVRANMFGAKVLCVDLDMQGSLSLGFNVKDSDLPVLMDVVDDKSKFEDAILEITPTLHLLPSHMANSVLDKHISQSRNLNQERFLSDYLDKVRNNYDLIIIDCAPALSHLNTSIALASDIVVIPVNPDRFAIDGLEETIKETTMIREKWRSAKFQVKILFTKYDAREKTSMDYLTQVKHKYPKEMYGYFIRNNADLKNAISENKNIFEAKKSPAREDYDMFTREVMGIAELSEASKKHPTESEHVVPTVVAPQKNSSSEGVAAHA